MTALAAGLALVPIALSAGEPGSEIQAPMAMVIMFGLLNSTALNMVVVPILYERFGRCPLRGSPHEGAIGSTKTTENDQGLALSTNRTPSIWSPFLSSPVAM